MKIETFAMYNPHGSFYTVDTSITEQQMWNFTLGWPDEEDIKYAKSKGYKIVKALLIIEEDENVVS